MKREFRFYRKLFLATFTLSAFTVGGGYVIVPLMRKRFVEQYGWIEEEEMLDMVALAQSAPGPLAVNASILIGYRLAGFRGAVVTTLGTALPPLIILSVLSLIYDLFRDNRYVSLFLRAMQAGVAAVIVDAVITLARGIIRGKNNTKISAAVMAACFVAAFVLKINVMLVILVCALVGVLSALIRLWKQKRGGEL